MVRSFLVPALVCAAATGPFAAAAETPLGIPQVSERNYTPAISQSRGGTSPGDQWFATFAPRQDASRDRIDYEIWDFALKNMLVDMGPSTRQGAPRPDSITGTRLKYGPQSRYRLEGSLVLFHYFDKDVIASFTEYRQDLERVAGTLDISGLPRDEQLAFWINLHNVALLEQIANEWPVREPHEITVGGVPLDDAKFINLRGIPVSLRDIRENIVFRHWKDPKVIYGFWRGQIGGRSCSPMPSPGRTSPRFSMSPRPISSIRCAARRRTAIGSPWRSSTVRSRTSTSPISIATCAPIWRNMPRSRSREFSPAPPTRAPPSATPRSPTCTAARARPTPSS